MWAGRGERDFTEEMLIKSVYKQYLNWLNELSKLTVLQTVIFVICFEEWRSDLRDDKDLVGIEILLTLSFLVVSSVTNFFRF